ncbi:MAG: hypothetical protein J6K38_06555 [Alistipes sp.]|nr:hypothetical protein [Alistipes sp.]
MIETGYNVVARQTSVETKIVYFSLRTAIFFIIVGIARGSQRDMRKKKPENFTVHENMLTFAGYRQRLRAGMREAQFFV